MKKIIITIMTVITVITLVGCDKEESEHSVTWSEPEVTVFSETIDGVTYINTDAYKHYIEMYENGEISAKTLDKIICRMGVH